MKKKNLILATILVLIVAIATLGACSNEKDNTTNNSIDKQYNIENGNFAFSAIAEKVMQSSVIVTCGNSTGSGVVISKDGYILTNDHVVNGATKATVEFVDKNNPNKYHAYSASVVEEKNTDRTYSKIDLALLKIDDFMGALTEFMPCEIEQEELDFGDYGMIVGNPKGIGLLCSRAMVANPRVSVSHTNIVLDYIALDATVNPGNSGGGFYTAEGKLGGIVTLRQVDSSNINQNVVYGIGFAIPSRHIIKYLKAYML